MFSHAVRHYLFAALLMLCSCSTPARVARTVPEGTPQLAVMTYNLNYGIAGDRATLEAIAARPVDLVLLQETNEAWEVAIRSELGATYPHMQFFHCCLAGGLAVLSKGAIREAQYLEPKSWFPALRIVVDSPLGPIQALNVHLRPPFDDDGSLVKGYFSTPKIRVDEITAFAKELAADYPTLIAGDFNEGAGDDAMAILAAKGFQSVLPEFDPDAETWRWNTSFGEVSSTLDHICYDRKLEPLDVKVIAAGRSDHLPVVASFVRGGAGS